jgi:hypothetical protein
MAPEELAEGAGAEEDGAEDGGADEDGGAALGAPPADELEPLLHAATVAASARPSAGAIIRRARRFNRTTRLPWRMWF